MSRETKGGELQHTVDAEVYLEPEIEVQSQDALRELGLGHNQEEHERLFLVAQQLIEYYGDQQFTYGHYQGMGVSAIIDACPAAKFRMKFGFGAMRAWLDEHKVEIETDIDDEVDDNSNETVIEDDIIVSKLKESVLEAPENSKLKSSDRNKSKNIDKANNLSTSILIQDNLNSSVSEKSPKELQPDIVPSPSLSSSIKINELSSAREAVADAYVLYNESEPSNAVQYDETTAEISLVSAPDQNILQLTQQPISEIDTYDELSYENSNQPHKEIHLPSPVSVTEIISDTIQEESQEDEVKIDIAESYIEPAIAYEPFKIDSLDHENEVNDTPFDELLLPQASEDSHDISTNIRYNDTRLGELIDIPVYEGENNNPTKIPEDNISVYPAVSIVASPAAHTEELYLIPEPKIDTAIEDTVERDDGIILDMYIQTVIEHLNELQKASTAEECRDSLRELQLSLEDLLVEAGYDQPNEEAERIIQEFDIDSIHSIVIRLQKRVQHISSKKDPIHNKYTQRIIGGHAVRSHIGSAILLGKVKDLRYGFSHLQNTFALAA